MQEFTFENNEGSCDKVVQMWQHSDMWGHPNTKRKKKQLQMDFPHCKMGTRGHMLHKHDLDFFFLIILIIIT